MVRELTPISGVYLLYGRKTVGRKFYIGESLNVIIRLKAHVRDWIRQPRLILLLEMNGDEPYRLQQEARFIAAAVKMGLPLVNNSGVHGSDREKDLGKETVLLEEALNVLGLVQTPDKQIVAVKPAAQTLPLFPRKKASTERFDQSGIPDDFDRLVTPTEVAERFKISEKDLRKYCTEGLLPHIRLSTHLLRFRSSNIDEISRTLATIKPWRVLGVAAQGGVS